MNKQQEQLEALRDIRTLMERSSRFLSLSGLAGVVVGVLAIACIIIAYGFLGLSPEQSGYQHVVMEDGEQGARVRMLLLADFGIVLLLSLLTGCIMAMRKAKRLELPVWDLTTKRLLINMAIPLAAGGIYAIILIYHGHVALVAPATLIFYGLALIHASKYTINDIRHLGVAELITGLVASVFPDYGLLFWAFGFGVLHIVYGMRIHYKYEK
jgi:predicted lysophospholipase L1 biosynthesis ABC-type transport system permease subunit